VTGIFESRPGDAFGIAAGVSHISSSARAAEYEAIAQGLSLYARQSTEALFELTYSAQIVEGWTVQPLVQYILHPNGGVDATGTRRLSNATVIGLRTTIRY
jgi:porin